MSILPDPRRSAAALLLGLAAAIMFAACSDRDPTGSRTPRHTLSLELSGHGSGTVTSDPAGIDCTPDGGACSAEFARGTRVTLTASPAAGHAFLGWSTACGEAAVCAVEVGGDLTVTAGFDDPVVAGEVVGSAGGTVVSRDGRLTLEIPAGALSADEEITIRAIDASDLGPEFDEIVAMGPVRAYDLGPDGLTFAQPVIVTIVSDHSGPSPENDFELVAQPLFTLVDGTARLVNDVRSRVDPASNRMLVEAPIAHFSPYVVSAYGATMRVDGRPLSLRVGAVATLEFSVGFSEEFEKYAAEQLGISSDAHGSSLAVWQDQSRAPLSTPRQSSVLPRLGNLHHLAVDYTCSEAGTGTLTGWMVLGWNDQRVVSFHYPDHDVLCIGTPQALTVAIAGTGDGRVTSQPAGIDCTKGGGDCDETYPAGTAVELTAAAAAGSVFEGWSGHGTGNAESTTVVMDSARHVVANFARVDEAPPQPGFWGAALALGGISGSEALGRILFGDGLPFTRNRVRSDVAATTDDCPALLVTGTGGAAVVRSCRDELVKPYTARFADRVYYDGFFLPMPAGSTGNASLLLSGQGYALCELDGAGDLQEFCLFDFNRSTYPDAAAVGGDPARGVFLVNANRGQLEVVRWDAAAGGYRLQHDVGGLSERDDLRPFVSVASNALGDRLLLVVQDNLVSELYFVNLTASPAVVQRVMQLRPAARRLRCDAESGLCALSHLGGSSSTRLVTLFRWDGETAPRESPTNVVLVGDGLANGPVGIDVHGSRVVTAGFHDNQYSLITVDLAGSATGGGDLPFTVTTRPLPEGCTQPGHAAFARDRHRAIVASCHGSDGWAYVPLAY